jgi:hypothetical protein
MDMRFGTRKTRSVYKVGSETTIAKEMENYKLDLVRIQEVR